MPERWSPRSRSQAQARPVTDAAPGTGGDAAGGVVAVCGGRRCAALWLRHSQPGIGLFDAPGPATLRDLVRTSRGAVLVRTGCVGRCHAGPVVAVADRAAGSTLATGLRWVEQADGDGGLDEVIATL